MLGTIVNAAAILAGGLLGLLIKGGLKDGLRSTLSSAIALSVIFVGISGALGGMLDPESNDILFIISMVIGALLGEWIGIERRLETLGNFLQSKLQKGGGDGESTFSQGFVTASLLYCVGTMAIMGSIESGVKGEYGILFAKSILDGIMAIVLASTLGMGVLFSAVSVFIYQGILTMLAVSVSPYLTADMLREISIVGGILITGLGLNQLGVTKIRVGNLLPAIVIPVIYLLVAA